MSIRLNKVTRDLNVGIQTVATFLRKKGFEIELTPNTKITDEQYELLVKEFSTDKNLKIESERISQERQKEKKAAQEENNNEPQEIETIIDESLKPHIKSVGKIDLDSLHKKPEEPKARPVEEPEVEEPEVTVESPVEAPTETSEPAPEETDAEEDDTWNDEEESYDEEDDEPEAETTVEEVEDQNEVTPQEAAAEASEETKEAAPAEKGDNIFKLSTVKTPGINVVGKIDLSAINQQTRPKKKSKEEKRKEREAKEKQRVDNNKRPATPPTDNT